MILKIVIADKTRLVYNRVVTLPLHSIHRRAYSPIVHEMSLHLICPHESMSVVWHLPPIRQLFNTVSVTLCKIIPYKKHTEFIVGQNQSTIPVILA